MWHSTVRAVAKAVRTTGTFFKNHAAAIASFAASTATFMGCEAVLGVATGGVGAIAGAVGCGALAGAVGGAIDQTSKCVEGQSGACSVGAFAGSTLLGAAGGAVGGFLGGSLGGKLAESFIGKALPDLVTNTLEGAAIGGATGGATGTLDYGLTCSSSSAGCSWSGAAAAAGNGALSGAIGGAAAGAASTLAEPILGRLGSSGCGGPHSFTGSTQVLMADGSTKPIDQIKVGDKIENGVPGKNGTQDHKVTRVIVTHTDHDFVDVTIAPVKNRSLGSRVASKAKLGLAAAAAGLTLLAGAHAAARPAATTSIAAAQQAADTTPVQGSTLTTTFHHPFYDQTQAAFTEAKDLKVGDLLQTPTGNAEVTGVRLYHANTTHGPGVFRGCPV